MMAFLRRPYQTRKAKVEGGKETEIRIYPLAPLVSLRDGATYKRVAQNEKNL